MKWSETILMFIVTGIITVVGNTVGYKHPLGAAMAGYLFLIGITLLGMALARYLPFKMPMVFWISILAVLSTSPISPFAKTILEYTNKMEFLALATPILAYAGLAVGKDLDIFKKMSWRIIVVALLVYTGTFVCATIIAQFMLRVEGLI
ncbi:conserved membrane hypothetical protein [uncultured Sporomusa sp.]|uniref:DUF340 domain-containing protein n=1 Tax=uncultured Sporomusa sp. TaxID=307249 RepID=A0A212LVB4_9FIRM|nr:hypothetical protein [uncultured Sporomusa sp.]SCM81407.1 conserved membrane hypothetical protein [uncultured Sporomusa sp.]